MTLEKWGNAPKSREILMFVCLQKDAKQCCEVTKTRLHSLCKSMGILVTNKHGISPDLGPLLNKKWATLPVKWSCFLWRFQCSRLVPWSYWLAQKNKIIIKWENLKLQLHICRLWPKFKNVCRKCFNFA